MQRSFPCTPGADRRSQSQFTKHALGRAAGKLPIAHKFDFLLLQKGPQFVRQKQLAFLLACLGQTRAGSAQAGVIVSWMTDEFLCSLRQAEERLPEQGSVERSSLNHSDDAVRGG